LLVSTFLKKEKLILFFINCFLISSLIFGLLTCHHQQAFIVTSMPKHFTTLELQSPSWFVQVQKSFFLSILTIRFKNMNVRIVLSSFQVSMSLCNMHLLSWSLVTSFLNVQHSLLYNVTINLLEVWTTMQVIWLDSKFCHGNMNSKWFHNNNFAMYWV
jgi:hypothetical protein